MAVQGGVHPLASTSPFSVKHGSEDSQDDGRFTARPTSPSWASATISSSPNDVDTQLGVGHGHNVFSSAGETASGRHYKE